MLSFIQFCESDKYKELEIPDFLKRKPPKKRKSGDPVKFDGKGIDPKQCEIPRKKLNENAPKTYRAARLLKRLKKRRSIDSMKHDRKKPQPPKEPILNILKGMFGIGIDKNKGKKKKKDDEDVQDTSGKS